MSARSKMEIVQREFFPVRIKIRFIRTSNSISSVNMTDALPCRSTLRPVDNTVYQYIRCFDKPIVKESFGLYLQSSPVASCQVHYEVLRSGERSSIDLISMELVRWSITETVIFLLFETHYRNEFLRVEYLQNKYNRYRIELQNKYNRYRIELQNKYNRYRAARNRFDCFYRYLEFYLKISRK